MTRNFFFCTHLGSPLKDSAQQLNVPVFFQCSVVTSAIQFKLILNFGSWFDLQT